MSHERDICATSDLMRSFFLDHAFLHCHSTYLLPSDVNLRYHTRLKSLTRTVVGYSSHDGNASIPLASIALGASILEFHITRDRNTAGTDHRASLGELPGDFVHSCRIVDQALGTDQPRIPSQGEIANFQALGKSFALKTSKEAGHILTTDDLVLVSRVLVYVLSKGSTYWTHSQQD